MSKLTLTDPTGAIDADVVATLPNDVQKVLKDRERKGKPVTEIWVVRVEKTPISKKDPLLVEDDDDELGECFVGYLAKPDGRIRALALSRISDQFAAGNVIVRNCWLGGDEELRTDEEINLFASLYASDFIEVHRGNLRRL